jgi:hypothetical protein
LTALVFSFTQFYFSYSPQMLIASPSIRTTRLVLLRNIPQLLNPHHTHDINFYFCVMFLSSEWKLLWNLDPSTIRQIINFPFYLIWGKLSFTGSQTTYKIDNLLWRNNLLPRRYSLNSQLYTLTCYYYSNIKASWDSIK